MYAIFIYWLYPNKAKKGKKIDNLNTLYNKYFLVYSSLYQDAYILRHSCKWGTLTFKKMLKGHLCIIV